MDALNPAKTFPSVAPPSPAAGDTPSSLHVFHCLRRHTHKHKHMKNAVARNYAAFIRLISLWESLLFDAIGIIEN